MPRKYPEVSVIIPTYNRESMVVEAVESVLAQSMTDFELIVINDGSTDETEERLSAYGSRLKNYQQENAGVSAARNRGIKFSTAPLIAFLDSDDLWLPSKLQVQHKYMTENPKIHICQTEDSHLPDRRDLVEKWPPGQSKKTPSETGGGYFSAQSGALPGKPFCGDNETGASRRGGLF